MPRHVAPTALSSSLVITLFFLSVSCLTLVFCNYFVLLRRVILSLLSFFGPSEASELSFFSACLHHAQTNQTIQLCRNLCLCKHFCTLCRHTVCLLACPCVHPGRVESEATGLGWCLRVHGCMWMIYICVWWSKGWEEE